MPGRQVARIVESKNKNFPKGKVCTLSHNTIRGVHNGRNREYLDCGSDFWARYRSTFCARWPHWNFLQAEPPYCYLFHASADITFSLKISVSKLYNSLNFSS